MGVNVEGDLEAEEILHNFALSKDENKSKDRNIVLPELFIDRFLSSP